MRSSMTALAALLILALAPGSALAKAPTKKEVDQTLLGLSQGQIASVTDADNHLHAMEIQRENVERELAIAKLELQAAKSWVDASKAVGSALDASSKAAEAAARTDELEDYAARMARARRTTEWREARWQSTRAAVSLQQAKITLTKSEVHQASAQVDLARLDVYDNAIGGSTDVEVEIGKAQIKIGRIRTQVGKDRRKAEEAERAYDDSVARAAQLDPSI